MKYDDMPGRIDRLPRDHVGHPVPWFVAWIDGKPDFRVIRPGGIEIALRGKLCWICGIPFLRQEDRVFVIGSMCAITRTISEPASHLDCATFAATHCPFLTTPQMIRRERHIPAGAVEPAGEMIRRNPGVALVWETGYKSWSAISDGNSGTLFNVGEPKRVRWYARGREATRAEVMESIDSGLPILRESAEAQGPRAVTELAAMHERALAYVPAGAS